MDRVRKTFVEARKGSSRPARSGPALAALALILAAGPAAGQDPAAEMLGKAAPPFRLSEVRSGETLSLEDLRGQLVVLHFGASW